MPHLHLLVPALLLPAAAAPLPRPAPDLPAFGLLFGRGEHQIGPGAVVEHWIAGHFGYRPPGSAPLAALALAGAGVQPGTSPWLRADPVHLHPHGTTLTLVRSRDTALTAGESAALRASLNQLFDGDGLQFEAFDPHPADWYLRLERAPALRTTPVAAVRGLGIDPWLPRGDDARDWQRRMSEVQMVLHDHPVNEARERAGLLPVNSLWLWGEGALGEAPVGSVAAVVADAPAALGFAVQSGIPARPVPPTLEALLQDLTPGETLVVLGDLAEAKALGDPDAIETSLQSLDACWISPGLAALRNGRVERLTVTAIDRHRTVSVTATRSNLRRFWRRPVGLTALAARMEATDG